jgi:hypothetical protein
MTGLTIPTVEEEIRQLAVIAQGVHPDGRLARLFSEDFVHECNGSMTTGGCPDMYGALVKALDEITDEHDARERRRWAHEAEMAEATKSIRVFTDECDRLVEQLAQTRANRGDALEALADAEQTILVLKARLFDAIDEYGA